jgi:hypothetical protein
MKGHHGVLFTPSFGSLSATAPRATKSTMNKIFNGGHYIPNWNFMLKTRMMLIDTCQPRISLLCSSSSYKIFNVKNIIFQIGILCQRQKMMTSCFSGWNCLMFRIITGNCLIELFFFRIFYPLLDRDLLHKNENKLITD